MENQQYVATTFAGLENVLADELSILGAGGVKEGRRAVTFYGDKALMYKANYKLRTALRILVPIDHFRIRTVDDLYRSAKRIAWENYIGVHQTFAIHHTIYSDLFKNSMFASLKVKDAIVDRFRQRYNKRPSINPRFPDVAINLHISGNECTVSIDSSGDSLHKRGYRVAQTEAPINEVLAAGLIKLSGWDAKQDLMDPMCGSGTILIEAAMQAYGIDPGKTRKKFAFQNWKDFDRSIFNQIEDESKPISSNCKIYGSDILRSAIDISGKNAKAANVDSYLKLRVADFKTLNIDSDNLFMIFNPPYGERISPEDPEFYSMVGERLKHHFENTTAWMISTPACMKTIGLRPSKKIPLLNGSIECSFRKYELYKGSKRGEK